MPQNYGYLPDDRGFSSMDSLSKNETSFEYLSNVKNRPRRIIYSDESEIDLQWPELPDRWTDRGIKCIKYVDDCLSVEKVFFKDAIRVQINGRNVGLAKAAKTKSHFRNVEYNANRWGMQINNAKTKMLCISSATSYLPEAYFHSTDGVRISSEWSMKILGLTLSNEPSVREHLRLLQKKFKCRIWALRHLKKNGFKQNDLVLVYTSMIRPVAEYCSSVFCSMTSASDSLEIERIQMQALKTIFG